ncbi:transporter substrate-binding domain-containing protein [Paraburkholderia caledonica]|uniref:Polar amino acid transport system substrate-binding protein n=1 Tax=Paraburkholderia caledonica TaxID=134536 RepID=A0AB73IMS4_9BURK|nr:polar amino acid transport system substrate-binding protein [Paraburkholderia caledonica]
MKNSNGSKLLAMLAAAIGFSTSLGYAADSAAIPETLKHAGQLNVGIRCDAPPNGFLDESGKPAGIDADFARYIAKDAFGDPGKAVFTCVTSATRIQMLTSGKVDLLIATIAPTDERRRVVDFTNSTNWGASGVLIRKGEPFHSLKDFNGKTLLSTKGNWQAPYIREHYPQIRLVLLDSMNDAITALRQGRADGLAEDTRSMIVAVSNDPSLQLTAVGFMVGWGAPAVRRGDDGLREYVNKLLVRAKQDGTFAVAVKKYASGPLQQAVLDNYLKPAPDGSTGLNGVLRE